MDQNRVTSRIRTFLEDQDEVIAAYLFGSVARGTDNAMSDIDIAILFSTTNDIVSRVKHVHTMVCDILGILDVDVISLRHADLAIRYNVIKEGVLFFERDPAERIAFERRTISEYFDMLPAWAEYDRHLRMRLQEFVPSD